MLRPIRTLFMLVLVFIIGIFFERYQHGTRCAEAGGRIVDEICKGIQR